MLLLLKRVAKPAQKSTDECRLKRRASAAATSSTCRVAGVWRACQGEASREGCDALRSAARQAAALAAHRVLCLWRVVDGQLAEAAGGCSSSFSTRGCGRRRFCAQRRRRQPRVNSRMLLLLLLHVHLLHVHLLQCMQRQPAQLTLHPGPVHHVAEVALQVLLRRCRTCHGAGLRPPELLQHARWRAGDEAAAQHTWGWGCGSSSRGCGSNSSSSHRNARAAPGSAVRRQKPQSILNIHPGQAPRPAAVPFARGEPEMASGAEAARAPSGRRCSIAAAPRMSPSIQARRCRGLAVLRALRWWQCCSWCGGDATGENHSSTHERTRCDDCRAQPSVSARPTGHSTAVLCGATLLPLRNCSSLRTHNINRPQHHRLLSTCYCE